MVIPKNRKIMFRVFHLSSQITPLQHCITRAKIEKVLGDEHSLAVVGGKTENSGIQALP
jgi:hypothetical protein